MLISSGFAPTASAKEPTVTTLPEISSIDTELTEDNVVIPGEYIITFKKGTTEEAIKADLEKYNAKVLYENYETLMYTVKLSKKTMNL